MRRFRLFLLTPLLLVMVAVVHADDAGGAAIHSSDVVRLTRFLEAHPLDQRAPLVRTALLQWEAKSKDVVDVVCPGVLSPVPSKSIRYSGELLVQFILGSAAHQIQTPADKGHLLPNQVAGMTSMLTAYGNLKEQAPGFDIPRLDELAKDVSNNTLGQVMRPLVAASCKG